MVICGRLKKDGVPCANPVLRNGWVVYGWDRSMSCAKHVTPEERAHAVERQRERDANCSTSQDILRFAEIDVREFEHPEQRFMAQVAVALDTLMFGYLRNPARTDAMLRRDGMTATADRLTELFGERWWERLA